MSDKPRKKHPKLTEPKPRELRERGWAVIGFDTSMSSIAGAAIGYDKTLDKLRGPVFTHLRWEKDDHYFDRLSEAAKSHEIVLGLLNELQVELNLSEVFIAQEEPFPMGMAGGRNFQSAFMKQQAEISGAFLGGLLRYGYKEIWQINSIKWRKMVADAIRDETGEDVTTHKTKWNSGALATRFNAKPAHSGKFRSKQWLHDIMEPWFAQQWGSDEIPNFPDIIETKDGKKPRPEGSTAKAVQPNDVYDAFAVCWFLFLEISDQLTNSP